MSAAEMIEFGILTVGYLVVGVCLFLVLLWPLEYVNNKGFFSITYLGFGFLWAKDEALIERCSQLRKVKRQRLFIEAPTWFNKYVYNFGVRGEK